MEREFKARIKNLEEMECYQKSKDYIKFDAHCYLNKELWPLFGSTVTLTDNGMENYYIMKNNSGHYYAIPKIICEVLEEKVSSTPTISNNDSECECCNDCDLDLDTQYVIDKANVAAYDDFMEVMNDEHPDAENIQFAVSYAEKMIILCENFLEGIDCNNEECNCKK